MPLFRTSLVLSVLVLAQPVLAQSSLPDALQELDTISTQFSLDLEDLGDVLQEHEVGIGQNAAELSVQGAEIDQLILDNGQDAANILALQEDVLELQTSEPNLLFAAVPSSTPTYIVPVNGALKIFPVTNVLKGDKIDYDNGTGQITLQPGLYEIQIDLSIGNFTNTVYLNLFDITAGVDVPGGYVVLMNNTTTSSYTSGPSSITSVLEIEEETVLELRNRGIHGAISFNPYINACRLLVREL